MPSPIAHFLAGMATHLGTAPRDAIADRRRTAVTVAAAIAPDLDYIPKALGWAVHQGASHSLGAAVIAGAVVFAWAAARGWRGAGGYGLAAGLGWASHIVLDLLNADTSLPIGLMALWPFDDGFYKTPWPVFLDIWKSFDWATVRHNTAAALWEMALLCPLVILLWRARQRLAA